MMSEQADRREEDWCDIYEAEQVGRPQPPPVSDTEVVIAIRGVLWEHMRGRTLGGDRSLVGMVNELARQRDEAEANRRGEFELRMEAERKLEPLSAPASQQKVCPQCGAPDPDLMPLTGRDESETRHCPDLFHKPLPAPASAPQEQE